MQNAISRSIATDASGNIYFVGTYESDSIKFGSYSLTNTDTFTSDIYLTKYDASGAVLWAKSFGGNSSDFVTSVAIDNAGNMYICGNYESPTLTFGSTTLVNTSTNDLFLAKLNSAGTCIWAKSIHTGSSAPYNCQATGVATDASGNAYLTGSFSDTVILGSFLLTHALLGTDIFVAKYDGSGNAIWAKSSDGAGGDVAHAITLDGSGNVYITGEFSSTSLNFDALTLTNTFPDNTLFFLVKYSPLGIAVWAKSAGDSNSVIGSSVATDPAGNVYVTGTYNSPSVVFGTTTLTNTDPTASSDDIFLVKYNSAGSMLWAKSVGGSSEDIVNGIAVDPAGNSYLTGLLESPSVTFGTSTLTNIGMFLAKFNNAGNPLWGKGSGNMSSSWGSSVARDGSGNLYVGGLFNSPSVMLDTVTLTDPVGPYIDVFVAKYKDVPSGIPTVGDEQASVKIFPNPASQNAIVIASVPITTIVATNLLGQAVFEQSYSGKSAEIDVAHWPAGVYFLRINGSMVEKFVKK